ERLRKACPDFGAGGSDASATTSNPSKRAGLAELRAAMEVIPNDDVDWLLWNETGMSLWAATGGSDEGLDIFMEWSARSMKHDHDKTVARWRHYKSSPPTKLGAGSIFWRANDADPNWRFNIEYPESFESMESPSAAPEDDDLIGDAPKQGEPKSEEKAR